jgi:hypothetical protein
VHEAIAYSEFPDDDDGDSTRPEYAPVLERRFRELTAMQQSILWSRFCDRATLDKVGADIGLTRERVRQIEAQALDELAGKPPKKIDDFVGLGLLREIVGLGLLREIIDAADAERVREAVAKLGQLELPATESRFVEAGFEPLDRPTTRLLLAVANRMGAFGGKKARAMRHGGRQWLVAGDRTPERLVRELTEAARDTGVVGDLVEFWEGIEVELRAHVGSDNEAVDLAQDVVDGLGLEEIGGEYAVLGGVRVVEGLVRILRANGEPMARDTLVRYFPDRSERTLSNALLKPPFVRVGPDEFALQEWGATPHPTLRDLVYSEIDQYGQVAVSYLQELAVKHRYSRNSIAFYSALPDVIEDAGVLRRRRKGDPPAVRAPWLDGACFRVIAGTHRGDWSCMVVISHRRLYTGPQPIPTPLAELLEIEPGASRVPITVGGSTIHASWLHAPYLFGGQLRPVLDELGFADGQHVRLVAAGPRQLLIVPLPSVVATTADNPFDTLISAAGLYDEAGRPVADGEVAEALSFTVGFDGPAPVPVVERRLTERRNGALREAFVQIFPEELGRYALHF